MRTSNQAFGQDKTLDFRLLMSTCAPLLSPPFMTSTLPPFFPSHVLSHWVLSSCCPLFPEEAISAYVLPRCTGWAMLSEQTHWGWDRNSGPNKIKAFSRKIFIPLGRGSVYWNWFWVHLIYKLCCCFCTVLDTTHSKHQGKTLVLLEYLEKQHMFYFTWKWYSWK